jgi:hypothetical protein
MYIRRQRLSRRTFVSKPVNVLVGVNRAWREDAEPFDVSSSLRIKSPLRRSSLEERERYESPQSEGFIARLIAPGAPYTRSKIPEWGASDPRAPIFGGKGLVICLRPPGNVLTLGVWGARGFMSLLAGL